MTEFRRNRVAGGVFFFTANLQDRRSDLLVRQIDDLRAAVLATQARYPFQIDGRLVLPDHMHCLWTLPAGDADYSVRWQSIKSEFSRSNAPTPPARASSVRKREKGIWQRRFWEHTIRDEDDYAAHLNYIHFNLVKHGWVAQPTDWPYSTFLRFVARGVYARDWTGDAALKRGGERV